MTDCIINIVSGKVFIQFDQVIENGVLLVFSEIKNLLDYQEIKNTNTAKFLLPVTKGKISIHIFFGQIEIIRKINVSPNHNVIYG